MATVSFAGSIPALLPSLVGPLWVADANGDSPACHGWSTVGSVTNVSVASFSCSTTVPPIPKWFTSRAANRFEQQPDMPTHYLCRGDRHAFSRCTFLLYAYLLSLVGGVFHRGSPLLSQSLAAAIRHTMSKDYSFSVPSLSHLARVVLRVADSVERTAWHCVCSVCEAVCFQEQGCMCMCTSARVYTCIGEYVSVCVYTCVYVCV